MEPAPAGLRVSVRPVPTSSAGPLRLGSDLTRQGVRFAVVGTAGTAVQLALYLVALGPLGATLAGATSWVVSTILTNLAQRALTFGRRTRRDAGRDHTLSFATSLTGLGLVTLVTTATADLPVTAALGAIVGCNVAVGVARFFLLRTWFGRRRVG